MARVDPKYLVLNSTGANLEAGVQFGELLPSYSQIVHIFVRIKEDFNYGDHPREGIMVYSNQAQKKEIVDLMTIPKTGVLSLDEKKVPGFVNTPYAADATLTAKLETFEGNKGRIYIAIGYVDVGRDV